MCCRPCKYVKTGVDLLRRFQRRRGKAGQAHVPPRLREASHDRELQGAQLPGRMERRQQQRETLPFSWGKLLFVGLREVEGVQNRKESGSRSNMT